MFPTLSDITKLIEDASAGKVSAALRDGAAIMVKVADTYDLFLQPDAPKEAIEFNFEACCGALEVCAANLSAKAGPADPKEMDPASIVMIINAVLTALKAFRDWRKNR